MKILITEQQLRKIVNEALPLDVAKRYSSIQRSYSTSRKMDMIFSEILRNNPDAKTSKRGDRIYIPFETEINDENIDSQIKNDVESILSKSNIKIKDYKKGIAIEPKYNREVKIGKVLNSIGENDLLNKFADDPYRKNTKNTERYAVISKHPYDIAGMSTDRGWLSCMHLFDGGYRDFVAKDVELGTIIAYEIKLEDINIKNPIGRVLIKPYSNNMGDIHYSVCETTYGEATTAFHDTVSEVFSKLTTIGGGKYTFNNELYADGDLETIEPSLPQKIRRNGKFNLVKNGKLVGDTWYPHIGDFDNGFAIVRNYKNKRNFFNINGEIISKIWFDTSSVFENGFAKIENNNKYNFINVNGEITSKLWFDDAYNFYNGHAAVKISDLWNFINTNGILIGNAWFDIVDSFHNNHAKVKIGDKWNYININGEIISKNWYKSVYNFDDGFGKVSNDDQINFINPNGELISNIWFDTATEFYKGFAKVTINNKQNLINGNGKIISKMWFDSIDNFDFENGSARVFENNKLNFINENGDLVSKVWYDYIYGFTDGLAKVLNNNKWNIINRNGELISKVWFDDIFIYSANTIRVKKNGISYKMDKNGNVENYQ